MEQNIEKESGVIYTVNHGNTDINLCTLDQGTWEAIREYGRLLDQVAYRKCLVELEKIKNGGKE